MHNVLIGDEVYSSAHQLFARVEAVFPAAVCVRVGFLTVHHHLELLSDPQLWSAESIENLSVCRYCGERDDLCIEHDTGVPYRVCTTCAHVVSAEHPPRASNCGGRRAASGE
jgi:hypothetical protein